MSRFRLLTPDAQYPDDAHIERQTSGEQVDWDIYRERSPENIPAAVLASCDAMVVWHEMPVTREVISQLDRCRIIVRAGVGFDHIDLDAAAEAGIPGVQHPRLRHQRGRRPCHRADADHAPRNRLLPQKPHGIPECRVRPCRAPLVARLRGKTFGVVGLGRIGIATALRANGIRHARPGLLTPLVSRGTEIAVGVDRLRSHRRSPGTKRCRQPALPLDASKPQDDQRRSGWRRCSPMPCLINTARSGRDHRHRSVARCLAATARLPVRYRCAAGRTARARRRHRACLCQRQGSDCWRTAVPDTPCGMVEPGERGGCTPPVGRDSHAVLARRNIAQPRQRPGAKPLERRRMNRTHSTRMCWRNGPKAWDHQNMLELGRKNP